MNWWLWLLGGLILLILIVFIFLAIVNSRATSIPVQVEVPRFTAELPPVYSEPVAIPTPYSTSPDGSPDGSPESDFERRAIAVQAYNEILPTKIIYTRLPASPAVSTSENIPPGFAR